MVAVLSVSGQTLEKCESVLYAMRKLGIYGDITHNKSVDPEGNIENGCRILIANKDSDASVQTLWRELKELHTLQCAHVSIERHMQGCIFDVFAPSKCPSAPP